MGYLIMKKTRARKSRATIPLSAIWKHIKRKGTRDCKIQKLDVLKNEYNIEGTVKYIKHKQISGDGSCLFWPIQQISFQAILISCPCSFKVIYKFRH